MVDGINSALKGFSGPEEALVILSNHSLPMEALEGDAYEFKIRQAVEKISEKVAADCRVAYQSQGGARFTWLGDTVPNAELPGSVFGASNRG